MAKTHGEKTITVAEKLKDLLEKKPDQFAGTQVFYDHGDSLKNGVCQPTLYMGRRYGSDATLSAIDIVIVRKNSVVIAVEIEEGKVRPKTILGDVFGIALADQIRIKGKPKPYSLKNASIIVAIAEEGKGKQPKKYQRLERLLNKYFAPKRSSNQKKVRIITCPTDDIVRRVERLIRLEAGKKIK